jgi:teichuronic acid biosynthesis glycosyltransferase TuaH
LAEQKTFGTTNLLKTEERIKVMSIPLKWLRTGLTKFIRLTNKLFWYTIKKEVKYKLQGGNYDLVMVFSSAEMGWHIPLYARTQHFARELAKRGNLVFYAVNSSIPIDNYVTHISVLEENLYLVNFDSPKAKDSILNLIINNTRKPVVYHFVGTEVSNSYEDLKQLQKRGVKILYDFIDEINPDINPSIDSATLQRHEDILKDETIMVLASADKLVEDIQSYRKKNYISSYNGVNLEDWVIKDEVAPPDKLLRIIELKKPIIGFYGALAKWLDFELLNNLAEARSEYQFVLIGIDYDGSLLYSNLLNHTNVHYLGHVKYPELKYYAHYFDACILPFRLYGVGESVSPVKLFEHMAQQLPIVSTNIRECRKYDSCLTALDGNDFLTKLDLAITLKNNPDYKRALLREASQNTWSQRVDDIIALIERN